MQIPNLFGLILGKWRKKDPIAEAEAIKAKFQAKRTPQGMFTPAQEELMEELGLTPGKKLEQDLDSEKKPKAIKPKKSKDPLTARQRKLAEELGLIKPDKDLD